MVCTACSAALGSVVAGGHAVVGEVTDRVPRGSEAPARSPGAVAMRAALARGVLLAVPAGLVVGVVVAVRPAAVPIAGRGRCVVLAAGRWSLRTAGGIGDAGLGVGVVVMTW